MKKQNLILSAALAAVFSASTAFAEAEVTGKIVHESAKFTTSGSTVGTDYSYGYTAAGINTATAPHGKDAFKQETSARIYVDGSIDEITDGATYHVELNLMKDGKATTNYDSNESYTQRDPLREAYLDSQVGDWSIRTGKQQVVWGTADGMKLLDMINPTDYGEMAQNQMEDSRIPVWMVNAEKTLEDGSEMQIVVSQPKENVFAGLNRNTSTAVRENLTARQAPGTSPNIAGIGTDTGNPFVMKGPDTITGRYNGFLNITPDLGTVAAQFSQGFDPVANATGWGNLTNYSGFTVGGFAGMNMGQMSYALGGATTTNVASLTANFQGSVAGVSGIANGTTAASATDAQKAAITGKQMLELGFAAQYDTNLANYAASSSADSAFEYMPNATFKTFDSLVNAKSKYEYNMPSNSDMNLALKKKGSTKNGLNYSLNYSYNYDQNPVIDLSWKNSAGDLLSTTYESNYFKSNDAGRQVAATAGSYVRNASSAGVTTSVILTDANGTTYASGLATTTGAATSSDYPVLHFSQTVKRLHNIGGSFDTAIETKALGPVVIRGEALYQKDVYQPVLDKAKLSIGDMVGALEMVKGDRFKYVLGADITVLTNMMVSAQFIQDRNLDYVDETSTPDANNPYVTGSKYTADFSTMHLTNDFNKAEKNKEFYSLFLSKPFGASGEHRWNNIIMFEENGGKWNRLDAEFSIDDDTQATVEYNKYWGDENTQFGQLEKSSNIQVGVKYSF